MNTPHLLIVGATSGIGLALAKDYLQKGWQVTIVGSNTQKIADLTELQVQNPQLSIEQCNLAQPKQLDSLLDKLSGTSFNHFIYSAGWYLNERKQKLNKADSQKMLTINLQVFHRLFAWASIQLQQLDADDKHMVCLSSIAGMLTYKKASLYAKCKHAMLTTSDAYRTALQPFGIKVTCIASGYVDTAQLRFLNDGDASHKPFIISEAQAVSQINYAIANNLALHCFPKQMRRIIGVLSCLPKPVLNTVMTWQYKQQDKQQDRH